MKNNIISILLADDHQLFRSGLVSLLDGTPDLLIVGEAGDGKELIDKYFNLKPDIVLIDISMPKLSGTNAFKKIQERDPEVKALFVSMFEGEEYIYHLRKLGAKGLISKNIMKGELVYALRTVYENNEYFGRNWTTEKLNNLTKRYKSSPKSINKDFIDLSKKEKIILKYISEGKTSAEIAELLNKSKRTIDSQRVNLMHKLGISALPELIKYAIDYTATQKLLNE